MKQKEWKEDKNSSLLTFSNIWNNIELCESMANSEALQVNELLSLQNLITFFHPMSFSANFKWLYLVIILPNVNFFFKKGERMFLFSLFSFAFFALQNEKESQGNTQQIQIMKI